MTQTSHSREALGSRLVHVLIVDSQPYLPLVIEMMLWKTEPLFLCRHAPAFPQALAECRSEPPDLVLLSITPEDPEGLVLLARLQADPRTARIPVVVISTPDQALAADAMRAGAASILFRPLDQAMLRQALNAILREEPSAAPDPYHVIDSEVLRPNARVAMA